MTKNAESVPESAIIPAVRPREISTKSDLAAATGSPKRTPSRETAAITQILESPSLTPGGIPGIRLKNRLSAAERTIAKAVNMPTTAILKLILLFPLANVVKPL
jgi:hypothetical protein